MIDHTGTTSRIDRRPELVQRLRSGHYYHASVEETAGRIDQLEAALAAAKDALEAMKNPARYDSRSSNIWKFFYPAVGGQYVNLSDFGTLRDEALAKINELMGEG